MKHLHIAVAAGLGLAALAATPALAAVNGYVTANVNERSGPSTSYPPITVIPAGSPITIYGCLSNNSWCDISWGPNRGWMSANYLQVSYQSRRIPVRGYSGIPFITFNFGTYWDSHYRNRPFFNQRSKWSNFHWKDGSWPNGNNQNQNPGQNNPWPKPPKHMGDNGNYNNGPNGNGPGMGNGPNGNGPGMGNGPNGNGPKYGNGPKNGNKYGKNCKWIDGKWVCTP